MLSKIEEELTKRKLVLEEICDTMQSYIYTASIIISETIDKNNNIFIFGNGRNIFNVNNLAFSIRKIKNATVESLCQDNVLLSEIANNYGWDRIYDKQIELRAKEGDLLIGFSTSGNSKNILRALSLGRNMECKTIGFSGCEGGAMDEFCDLNLIVPSDDIEKIQELHLILGNIILNFNSRLRQNNT